MGFFNIIGLIALIGVPIILILHMLKRKQKEVKIPSVYLWEKAVDTSVQSKPWQKLKKSLPLILQLAVALALGLAAARPYISVFGTAYNYVVVIDNSSSMSTNDMGETRLEYSKKQAEKLISNSSAFSKITVISSGEHPYVVYGPDTDKNAAIMALNQIKQTYGGNDMETLESLAVSEAAKTEAGIYTFTDDTKMLSQIDANIVYAGKETNNCAITLASAEGGSVLVNVRNYGEEECSKTLTIYNNSMVVATSDVTLPANSERSVVFENAYTGQANIMITLTPEDILSADDVYYLSVNLKQSAKILLVTEGNTFLENAIKITAGTELYKMNKATMETADLSDYDLYIFDGCMPEIMPHDGGVFIVNPPVGNSFIETSGTKQLNCYSDGKTDLSSGDSLKFLISEAKTVTKPSWTVTESSADGIPLILRGENNGQKVCVFTFDIHNSDLPLIKDFPIMIYNLTDWFIPGRNGITNINYCEEKLNVNILAASEKTTVTDPGGVEKIIAPPFPAVDYMETSETGFYKVTSEMSDGRIIEDTIAVNALRENESDIEAPFGQDKTGNVGVSLKGGASLMKALLFIAIFALIAEWWVKYSVNKNK